MLRWMNVVSDDRMHSNPKSIFASLRTGLIPVRLKVREIGVAEVGLAVGDAGKEKESTRTGTRTRDQSVKSRMLYQLSYPRVMLPEGGEGVGAR